MNRNHRLAAGGLGKPRRRAVAVAAASLILAASALGGLRLGETGTHAVQSPSSCPAPVVLRNGGFEAPTTTNNGVTFVAEGTANLIWQTTDSNNVVEVWKGSLPGPNGGVAITAQSGTQWVELNAYSNGTLYQDVATVPGQRMQWSIWHRARSTDNVAGNQDNTMQVRIGSSSTAPGSLTPQIPTGQTTANIVTSDAGWVNYTGSYTVPAGQTSTRFGFAAVSGTGGAVAIGNFLDNITFGNAPCLISTKTVTDVNAGSVAPGDVLEYAVTVTNSGGSPSIQTVLSDAVPANTTYVPGSLRIDGVAVTDAAADDRGQVVAGTVTARLGTGATAAAGGSLAASASATVRFRVTVNASAPHGTVISNEAQTTFRWFVADPVPSTSISNTVTSTVVVPPRLTLDKSVAGRVAAADQFAVTILQGATTVAAATTTGTATSATTGPHVVATGTTYTLRDEMAAGSTSSLARYTPTIACVDAAAGNAPVATAGAVGAWTVSNLTPPQDVRCTITNTPNAPVLTLNKALPSRIDPADQFTVAVSDGATPVASAATVGAATSASTGQVALIAGRAYTLTDVLTAGSSTAADYASSITCTNLTTGTATVLPAGPGGTFTLTPSGGDRLTCTFTNDPLVADLQLIKSDGNRLAIPGQEVEYTLTVRNNGPDAAQSVEVVDTPDPSLTIVALTPSLGGTCGAPATGTCTFPTLGPGLTATVTVRAIVAIGAPTAGAVGADANEPNTVVPSTDCAGADVCNSAAVSSPTFDPIAGNNVDDEPTDLSPTTITVRKVLVSVEPDLFDLGIDGAVLADDVGDGGTTGMVSVTPGEPHTIAEASTTGSLAAFTISWACLDGNGTIVASSAGVSVGPATGPYEFTVTPPATGPLAERTIRCTIINARNGELVLVKQASPTSPQDFTFTSVRNDGAPNPVGTRVLDDAEPDDGDANPSAVNVIVPGTSNFTVAEAAQAGWELTDITCSDIDGATTVDLTARTATLDFAAGEEVRCVYTNVEQARLTVTKQTLPDGAAGTFDFALTGGPTPAPFDLADGETAPVMELRPGGIYRVSETVPAGWQITGIACSGGELSTIRYGDNDTFEPGDTFAEVLPAAGEEIACEFTNGLLPRLTLLKDVVNDHGGTALDTDWTLEATGPVSASGPEGSAAVTAAPVAIGTYALTESGPAGYAASPWLCSGASASTGGSVTLAYGDVATCVITNDELAIGMDVVKVVRGIADGAVARVASGSDVTFEISVDNTGELPLALAGMADDSCSPVTYASGDVDGDGLLDVDETFRYTCTIVGLTEDLINTVTAVFDVVAEDGTPLPLPSQLDSDDAEVDVRPAPRLTLTKQVNGRVNPLDQFTVTIAGPGLPSGGVSATTTGAGTSATTGTQSVQIGSAYTLTDAMAAGSAATLADYTPTIVCTNALDGSTVTPLGTAPNWTVANLALDWDVRCTITNTAKPPVIDVVKSATEPATGPSPTGSYTVTHTVTVINSGPSAGTYGPLTDAPGFAPNLVVDGASWAASGPGAPPSASASGPGPFTLAPAGTAIAPHTTHTYDVTITFHFSNRAPATACTGASGGGLYDAAALPAGQENGPVTDNAVCTPPPAPPGPAITFDKQAGSVNDLDGDGPEAGETILYSFTVTNTGDVNLDPVIVSDPKVGPVDCGTGPLARDGVRVCSPVTYALTQADVEAGVLTNTATASGLPPQGAAVTATDSTSTPIPSNPATTLDKSSGAVADPDGNGPDAGDTITYTFLVTNTGNRPLSSIAISDPKIGPVACPLTALAPAAATTCTKAYTLTQADVNAGGVVNTATVTGTPPSGAPVTATDTDTRTFTAPPRIQLDKQAAALVDADANGADAGDTIAFTFDVTNTGNVTLDPVVVDDPKLGGAVACGSGPLAPGAGRSCDSVTYTVTQADVDGGAVVNTATATGTPPSGPTVASTDGTSTPILSNPKIDLQKVAAAPSDLNGSGITDAGDTIAYTFTITNLGNRALDPLTIDDPKVGPVSCAAGPLAPAGVRVCGPVTYIVTEDDEVAGSVDNTATATGTAPNGQVVTAADITSTPVTTPAPSLMIDKVAGTPVDVNASGLTDTGDTIAYTFTVTNTGNVPLSSVGVVDAKVGAVTCAATTLAPLASTVCRLPPDAPYEVTAADVLAGVVQNSAMAIGTDPDGGGVESPPDTTSTPTTRPAPALTIDKHAAAPVDVNGSGITDTDDTIQYTFTVTNTGNVPIDAIAIGDTIAGPVTCAATSLAPGALMTCAADDEYQITAADETAGRVDNSATVTGTDPDEGPVVSPPDTTSTPVARQAPSLLIDKRVVGAPVDVNGSGITDAGDTIQYTFTVTNTGNVPITAVDVTDAKLGDVACAASTLAVDESTTCTPVATPYVVNAADVTGGAVNNVAIATGTDPDDDPVESPPDTTSTPTTAPRPQLTIVKTSDAPVDVNQSGLTDAGDTIQYRFVVTNSGNVPITDIVVVDPTADVVTCTPTTLGPGEATVCAADEPYEITDADADVAVGVVSNTAHAEGTDPDGDPVVSNDDTDTTVVQTQVPALSLRKSVAGVTDVNGSGITDTRDTIHYTFVVTNAGNVPLNDVVVLDDRGLTVFCPATTLAVDELMECTATYTVQPADELATLITNVAHAEADDPDEDPVVSADDDATVPVTPQDPRFVLSKFAGAATDENASGITDEGDTIQYTFTVRNTGNVSLENIMVTDSKLTPSTFLCTAGPVAPGASVPCAAVPLYEVTDADEEAGVAINLATAIGTDPDGESVEFPADPPDDPPASTTTPVTRPQPQLTLIKVAGTPVDVNGSGITDEGDTIAYTFTVTNDGNVPIHDLVVTDARAGAVTCDADVLAPGERAQCAASTPYSVTAADETARAAVNVASATGQDPDDDDDPVTSNLATTTTPVTEPQPRLVLTKTAAAPVDVNGSGITDAGDTIQYAFTATNAGNVPLRNITVTDSRLTPSTFLCTAGPVAPRTTVPCAPVPLYRVTEADEDAGAAVNLATAVGTDPDGGTVHFPPNPLTDPPATTTTPVTKPQPGLTFEKFAGEPVDANANELVDAGDTIAYTFQVTNSGNVPISGVAVTDTIAGPVTCTPLRLLPTEIATCRADAPYVITQAEVDGGEAANMAFASGTDPDGGPVIANNDTTDTPADQAPALVIDKIAGPPTDANGSGRIDAGDSIAYTFTVTNTGTVTLTGVAVIDDALGAVTCDRSTLAPGDVAACQAASVHTITQGDVEADSYTNVAHATAVAPNQETVTSNDDTAITALHPTPSIALAKSAGVLDGDGDGMADAGETIEYTFLVTNTGTVRLTGIAVDDAKVGGVTCPVSGLDPGASTTCTAAPYTVTQADVDAGAVANTAAAHADPPPNCAALAGGCTPPTASSSTATPVDARPSLMLVKSASVNDVDGDGGADVGETILYAFTVTNTGTVTLASLSIADPMLDAAGTAVACPTTTLAPGATTTCTASHTVRAGDIVNGAITNHATATAVAPQGVAVASGASGVTTAAGWVSPPPGGPQPELPATGGNATVWSKAGLALLVIGILLTRRARRRHWT